MGNELMPEYLLDEKPEGANMIPTYVNEDDLGDLDQNDEKEGLAFPIFHCRYDFKLQSLFHFLHLIMKCQLEDLLSYGTPELPEFSSTSNLLR